MENTTSRIKIQEVLNFKPHADAWVRVQFQGRRYAVVRWMARPTKCHIKKISGREYVELSTGEIKEYRPMTDDLKTIKNLRVTFEKLRGLIRENFDSESRNQVFLTLTYRENMRDPKIVLDDFKIFWKRLLRHMKGHKLEYISVVEPQGRGAWHLHVMIKSDQPTLWIDKNKLKDMWGRERGNAYIEALKSDDVGSYYVAYFTDLLGSEQKKLEETDEKDTAAMSKKRKKGSRLKFYPKGMRFYRTSQGIKRPESKYVTYGSVVEEYGKAISERTAEIVDESENSLNTVHKATFKR